MVKFSALPASGGKASRVGSLLLKFSEARRRQSVQQLSFVKNIYLLAAHNLYLNTGKETIHYHLRCLRFPRLVKRSQSTFLNKKKRRREEQTQHTKARMGK